MTTDSLAAQSIAVDDDTPHRSRRVAVGWCLVVAPMAFTAAELLAPESGSDAASTLAAYAAHRQAGVLAAAVGVVSTMLFLPGFLWLVASIAGHGRRWANLAAAALVYGLVTAHAVLQGVGLAFWAMSDPSLDRGAMAAAVEVLMRTPAVGIPLLLGHQVFSLGVLALGIALWRSRRYPRWTAVAVLLWLVSDVLLGSVPGLGEVADVVSGAFGVAGLGGIGRLVVRGDGPLGAHTKHLSS
jgi:hypothetical protein